MLFRMELIFEEVEKFLDMNYIDASTIGYTLPVGIYEITDFNLMLKSLLTDDMKVNITRDDIRLRSNLTTNKTIKFTKRSFFYTVLAVVKSHSGAFGVIPGFVQLIPGSYKSDKPINITGIDKTNFKCDCIDGAIIDDVRHPIWYSFALDKPPGHKIIKEPWIKLSKKISKSVLSQVFFK